MTVPSPLELVAVSTSGVDAASCLPPPPVDVAADAASRRQDEPAACGTRLVRLAPASTLLHLAVLGYLNAGRQPR
jgi:hypothetical protein